MHSRSIVMVNLALMASLLFMDTGCRTKAGGWRWPWQRDRSSQLGVSGVGDPTLLESVDVANVMDEMGDLVSGARFEDTLQAVQGVDMSPVYFAFDS